MLKRKAKHDKMSLTRLHKRAWDLQSKAIRQEENGQCFTCLKKDDWKNMDLGHFRHGKNMDFIRENLHVQCSRCNRFLHGNLGIYAEKLEEKYGQGIIQKLNALADKLKIWKRQELMDIIEKYGEKKNPPLRKRDKRVASSS